MLSWNSQATSGMLNDTSAYVAVLNGNRFFSDNDNRLDTVVRLRRLFGKSLAITASGQFGSQIVPPGSLASHDVRIVGLDAQLAVRRVGSEPSG